MINITMELCNRPPLSKEAIVGYWNILKNYDLDVVRKALDSWVDSSSKAPTPHDLKDLCKPVTPIYNAIARKVDAAENKKRVKEITDYVAENLKPKRDMKDWARKIIANPSYYPDLSLKMAREALAS